MRRKTRRLFLKDLSIGGDSPVRVESMLKSPWEEDLLLQELKELEEAGCELVRISIPHRKALHLYNKIKNSTSLPLMGDFHFSFTLIKEAIDAGIDAIRINPANFPSSYLEKLVDLCQKNQILVRIGVNHASFSPPLPSGKEGSKKMVEIAREWAEEFLRRGHEKIMVSLKSSSIWETIWANEEFSRESDLPLHIGITEAGGGIEGIVKSSIGIGELLMRGIGDTLRVSLTAPSSREVEVAYHILRALGIRRKGPEFISCPSCGRSRINVPEILEKVKRITRGFEKNLDGITLAVMGCEVNGPGEAKIADLGIAGGKKFLYIFRGGKITRKILPHELEKKLREELRLLTQEDRNASE